jgi:hypothetical protein
MKIPYRIVTEPEPGDGTWHLIHSFMEGYGWENINEQCERKCLWFRDICEFFPELEKDLWKRLGADWRNGWDKTGEPEQVTQEELDDLFEKLVEPLVKREQERLKRMKDRPISEFKKITIPLIRKKFPKLIAERLTEDPLL